MTTMTPPPTTTTTAHTNVHPETCECLSVLDFLMTALSRTAEK